MKRALPVLLFAALAGAPFLAWGHHAGTALLLTTRIEILAIAAISLDLLVGAAGLVSFGHAAYLAIGAYAVAILDANDISEALIVLPVACLAAAAFAAATGAISLRTRGVNFIMITLAFAQMVTFAAGSLAAYGGDDGYSLTTRTEILGHPWLKGIGLHIAAITLLVLAWLLLRTLLASRFGRALRAIKQNRPRVQAMGHNAFAVELAAMTIAGTICAIAGVLLANLSEFASPAYATWQRSGDLLIAVILGGAGSLTGAILGAAAVVLLEEALGGVTEHWRILYGPILILAVLYARGGLVSFGTSRG